jgi:hypothetical protein
MHPLVCLSASWSDPLHSCRFWHILPVQTTNFGLSRLGKRRLPISGSVVCVEDQGSPSKPTYVRCATPLAVRTAKRRKCRCGRVGWNHFAGDAGGRGDAGERCGPRSGQSPTDRALVSMRKVVYQCEKALINSCHEWWPPRREDGLSHRESLLLPPL